MAEFFGLSGFLIAIVSIVILIIAFLRKKSVKIPLAATAIGICFIFLAFVLEEPTVQDSASSEQPKEMASEKTQDEKDAETASKKKADEEKEAAEKEETEKKKLDEKEYYFNEIQGKVNTQMAMFDEAWDTLWVTTFNGVSDGSVDVYTAYDNMKQLQRRYDTLYSSFPAISAEGLSKEHQESFDEYKTNMKDASMWRGSAAEKAMKMFDEGNFSPSAMDEIEGDVKFADEKMMVAIVALTSLEMELGIERE